MITTDQQHQLLTAQWVWVLESIDEETVYDEDEDFWFDEYLFEGLFDSADDAHQYIGEYLGEAIGPWQERPDRGAGLYAKRQDDATGQWLYRCTHWPIGVGAWEARVMLARLSIEERCT